MRCFIWFLISFWIKRINKTTVHLLSKEGVKTSFTACEGKSRTSFSPKQKLKSHTGHFVTQIMGVLMLGQCWTAQETRSDEAAASNRVCISWSYSDLRLGVSRCWNSAGNPLTMRACQRIPQIPGFQERLPQPQPGAGLNPQWVTLSTRNLWNPWFPVGVQHKYCKTIGCKPQLFADHTPVFADWTPVGGFLSHGGTPSDHRFSIGIFPYKPSILGDPHDNGSPK